MRVYPCKRETPNMDITMLPVKFKCLVAKTTVSHCSLHQKSVLQFKIYMGDVLIHTVSMTVT